MLSFNFKGISPDLNVRGYKEDTALFIKACFEEALRFFYLQLMRMIPVRTGFLAGSFEKLAKLSKADTSWRPNLLKRIPASIFYGKGRKVVKFYQRLPMTNKKYTQLRQRLTRRQAKELQEARQKYERATGKARGAYAANISKMTARHQEQLQRLEQRYRRTPRQRKPKQHEAAYARQLEHRIKLSQRVRIPAKYQTIKIGQTKYRSRYSTRFEVYTHYGDMRIPKHPTTGRPFVTVQLLFNGQPKYSPAMARTKLQIEFILINAIRYLKVNMLRKGWPLRSALTTTRTYFRRLLKTRPRPSIKKYIIKKRVQ